MLGKQRVPISFQCTSSTIPEPFSLLSHTSKPKILCKKYQCEIMSLMLFSKDFCVMLTQRCALHVYFFVYSLLCYIQNRIKSIPTWDGVTTNRWKCFIRDIFSWKCHSMLFVCLFYLSWYWQKTECSCTETLIPNFAYFINTCLKTTLDTAEILTYYTSQKFSSNARWNTFCFVPSDGSNLIPRNF